MPGKTLSELLTGIDFAGPGDIKVTGIHSDSRKVSSGDAFVAITGFETDGHLYIPQAIKQGAKAIVLEKMTETGNIPTIQVENTRRALSRMAASWYNFPAQELNVIGITGTNGKTTITMLLQSIIHEARISGGSIGTFGYTIKDKFYTTSLTTPDSLELHSYFHQMAEEDVRIVAMEVSSHALALERTSDIPFSSGIFTNLGRDHYDFHKTKEKYREAKGKLFQNLEPGSIAILNMDSPEYAWFSEVSSSKVASYSLENRDADYYYRAYEVGPKQSIGTINTPDGELDIKTYLLGRYNLSNILAAVAASKINDIPKQSIQTGIEQCSTISGRLELVPTPHNVADVYVDYAHTPDALKSVLEELNYLRKTARESGKIIIVFGCGGNRDREKRPEMGSIAEQFADEIIVTNDNPRYENPLNIINEIQEGIQRIDIIIEPDRRKAIYAALEIAEPSDIILIAGKGHEDYQIIDGVKHHFDDKDVVKEAAENSLYL